MATSRTVRASGGVSGSRRRMPRVSAMVTAGQGPGAGGVMATPPRSPARHHSSTLGVAAVSSARRDRACLPLFVRRC